MSKVFGVSVGEALDGAQIEAGHTVHVKAAPGAKPARKSKVALYPVAVVITPEAQNRITRKYRLTVDAQVPQRGEVWFAKIDAASAFLVSEAKFIGELRIHRLRLTPFKRSPDGKIETMGALTMVIPGKWRCSKCGQSKEISFAKVKQMQGDTNELLCRTCGTPTLVRVPADLKRVDIDDPAQLAIAKEMYKRFREGADAETKHLFPRVWATYRVDMAPPSEAWMPEADDHEAMALDTVYRRNWSTSCQIDGTVAAVVPNDKGSGFCIWVRPANSTSAAVYSPVEGTVADTGVTDGKVVLAIKPADGSECQGVEVPAPESMNIVQAGAQVKFGGILAMPQDWVAHNVKSTHESKIVDVNDPVAVGQRLTEGYTIRPVKVAKQLGFGGVKELCMAASCDTAGTIKPRFGWLSWRSLTGGLSEEYGYTVYAAKEHVQRSERGDAARVARV